MENEELRRLYPVRDRPPRAKMFRGRYYKVWTENGKTRRLTLHTADRDTADAALAGQPVLVERLARPARGAGTVYFVQCASGGPIKIGWATDLAKRLRDMQQVNPRPLRVLAHIAGTIAAEHALHVEFADCRLHGEWFEPSDRLLARIRELCPPSPPPEAG